MTIPIIILITVVCGMLAASITARLERNTIKLFVEAMARQAGIEMRVKVRVGWGWPFRKELIVMTELLYPQDTAKLQQMMNQVWCWMDERYGYNRDLADQ